MASVAGFVPAIAAGEQAIFSRGESQRIDVRPNLFGIKGDLLDVDRGEAAQGASILRVLQNHHDQSQVGNLEAAVSRIDGECLPAERGTADRLGELALAADAGERAVEMAFQRVQHGDGPGPPSGKPHVWNRAVEVRRMFRAENPRRTRFGLGEGVWSIAFWRGCSSKGFERGVRGEYLNVWGRFGACATCRSPGLPSLSQTMSLAGWSASAKSSWVMLLAIKWNDW